MLITQGYTFREQLGDILPNWFCAFVLVFAFYEIEPFKYIQIPIIQMFAESILFAALYVAISCFFKFEGALTLFQVIHEKVKFKHS